MILKRVKLDQNRSINEGAKAITKFFLVKIATVTLTLALKRLNLSKILSFV